MNKIVIIKSTTTLNQHNHPKTNAALSMYNVELARLINEHIDDSTFFLFKTQRIEVNKVDDPETTKN